MTSMNKDLQSIIEWGDTNLGKLNSSKSQCTVFSLKHESFKPFLIFNESNINADESLSMLGLTFKDDLSWKSRITSLVKYASLKLRILFRFRNYFTNKQLLTLSMLGLFVHAWSTAVTYGEDTLEWTYWIRSNLKLSVLFLLLH